jgi:hypothetical protein
VGLAAAAAAALLLLLLGRLAPAPAPSLASPALSVVAADGDPAALWIGLGREVDPVLAVIALESETP